MVSRALLWAQLIKYALNTNEDSLSLLPVTGSFKNTWLLLSMRESWKTGLYHPDVLKEFEAYLKCGILAHGFLRLRGVICCEEKVVGFSCKKKGFLSILCR